MPPDPSDDTRPAAMRAVVERISEDIMSSLEAVRGRPVQLGHASFELAPSFRPRLERISMVDFVGTPLGFAAVATDPAALRGALNQSHGAHVDDRLEQSHRHALTVSVGESLALLQRHDRHCSLLAPRTVSAPVAFPPLPCAVRRLVTDLGPIEVALCLDDAELASHRLAKRQRARIDALERELAARTRQDRHGERELVAATVVPVPRREFLERSQHAFEACRLAAEPIGLVLIDVLGDHEVDTSLGPAIADVITQRVAASCGELLGLGDILGRLGDHEFAVTVPERSRDDALELAGRISERIASSRFDVYDATIPGQPALIVAHSTDDDDDRSFRALLGRADAAMAIRRGHPGPTVAAA